jgi:peptide/nickel transport system substrate-binding protein
MDTERPTPQQPQERGDALARSFLNGHLTRRQFLGRAAALGVGAAAAGGLLGSVLAACGGSSTAPTPAASASAVMGGILKAALTGEPDSLDPQKSQIYTGAQVYDNIFSKLIDIDENQEFYGVLATKWEQTDEKTWVFDLVDNATFQNGEAFTADDVVYSFKRIADPKTASGYASLFSAVSSVEAVSPTQAVFHLQTSFAPFLTNMANNGQIVNKKAIEASGSERKPVGTGPFKIGEWVQGSHVTLERYDGYFKQGRPYLDGIDFRFLLVDQGRIDALRSGELDWVDAVPLQQLSSLKTDPDITLVQSALAGIPDFLAMNTKKAPFDNVAVRQAVALGIDREQIRAAAYFGAGENGLLEVPTGSEWYNAADNPYPTRDVEAARAKLAEAGFADGLTIKYMGLPQYPELLKTGQVVRDQLKEIGITMDIEQVDVSVWFDRFVKGDYQITSAYQERTIDPDNFYSLVLLTGAPINTTFYSNTEVDALIGQAAIETDMAKRKELYSQVRKTALGEAPLVFVHFETLNYAMRKAITGSTINPTLELRMENVSKSG